MVFSVRLLTLDMLKILEFCQPGITLNDVKYYHEYINTRYLLQGKIVVTRYRINKRFYVGKVRSSQLLISGIPIPPAAQLLYDVLIKKWKWR